MPQKTPKKRPHSRKPHRAAQSKFLHDHVVGRICRLVDQAWVSRSLRALEAAKLVERCGDPNDSRLALFSLTQRGRAILDEFRPYAAWSEKVLLNGVDAAALKALLDQLEHNTQGLIDTLEYMPRKSRREK